MLMRNIGEPINFLCVQRSRVYPDKFVSVSGYVREDNPEKLIIITVRHEVNGSEIIEQITMTLDEFEEIIEVVEEVKDRLFKAEESIL